MFDSSLSGPLHWPDAPSAWVCAWLKTAHDLVLVLDAQGLVLDVIQNDAYQPCDLRPWIGQHFRSLVDDDSVGKVDALWAHDASDAHVQARTDPRHVPPADRARRPRLRGGAHADEPPRRGDRRERQIGRAHV